MFGFFFYFWQKVTYISLTISVIKFKNSLSLDTKNFPQNQNLAGKLINYHFSCMFVSRVNANQGVGCAVEIVFGGSVWDSVLEWEN